MLFNFSDTIDGEVTHAKQQVTLDIVVLVLILVISPIVILLVRNATLTIQVTYRILKKIIKVQNGY